jgi:putative FmdB family regulatory protein
MPIYEYQCQACGHQLEVIQSFADNPLSECPACQKSALNKLISAPSFHLKGTGWYATDFKDSGKKSVEAADKNKASSDSDSTVTNSSAEKTNTVAAAETV